MQQGYGLSYGDAADILFSWNLSHSPAWSSWSSSCPHEQSPVGDGISFSTSLEKEKDKNQLESYGISPCASEEQFCALCWNCIQCSWFSPGDQSNIYKINIWYADSFLVIKNKEKLMISNQPGGLECCAGSNFSCPETLHLCGKANKPAWHAQLFCAASFEPCLWKWSRIVCRRTSQSVLQPLQEILLWGDCTFIHFCDRFNCSFSMPNSK